jgi:hypothetical protein
LSKGLNEEGKLKFIQENTEGIIFSRFYQVYLCSKYYGMLDQPNIVVNLPALISENYEQKIQDNFEKKTIKKR